jgi:hypothetical protein
MAFASALNVPTQLAVAQQKHLWWVSHINPLLTIRIDGGGGRIKVRVLSRLLFGVVVDIVLIGYYRYR